MRLLVLSDSLIFLFAAFVAWNAFRRHFMIFDEKKRCEDWFEFKIS